MSQFVWDDAKNEKLKRERGISFEAVIEAIKSGRMVDDAPHPNKRKYPHQHMMVVIIENYAYLVPYVEDKETRVLKSIIPSRKATKRYLKKEKT